MTNISVLENKISEIQKNLKILESYQKIDRKKIMADFNLKGAMERYLSLAVQATIDLADAYISYRKFRKPTDMKEIFEILYENKIIGPDLNQKLGEMVGFRNALIHGYDNLDYDVVFNVLYKESKDIKKFIKIIEEKI